MSTRAQKKFDVWAYGLAATHRLSYQLTDIWLQQHGFTAPRSLKKSELTELIAWGRV